MSHCPNVTRQVSRTLRTGSRNRLGHQASGRWHQLAGESTRPVPGARKVAAKEEKTLAVDQTSIHPTIALLPGYGYITTGLTMSGLWPFLGEVTG